MIGDWIALVARRLICDRTYQLTVSPAIADLQHEPAASARHRLLGYVAVWRALAGALAIDLADDLTLAFNREARAHAWRAGANVFGGLFLVNLLAGTRLIFAMEDNLGPDGFVALFVTRLPSYAATSFPFIIVPAAFVLTRRLGDATRPVLLSAVVVSIVCVATSFTLVVPAARISEQYTQAAVVRARMETTDPPRSLEAVRRELTVPLTRADQRGARRDRDSAEWHVIMARGASVFGLALIGIGLSRKRGWRVFNWAALAYLVWWGVLVAAITVYGRVFAVQPPIGLLSWTYAVAIFAAGTLPLLASRRDRRLKPSYLKIRSSFVTGSKN